MTPYRFGRDPITMKLDEWVRDLDKAKTLLHELRGDKDAGAGGPPAIEDSSFLGSLQDEQRNHLRDDVFGQKADQERGRQRRQLYRNAIRAALELALGIDADGDADTATSIAPIDTYWGCGQPFDQAWIGWNNAEGERRVTLFLFADTPATGWDDSLLSSVGRFPSGVGPTGLVVMYEAASQTHIKQSTALDGAAGSAAS
jgi:hypothetical protein